MAFERIKDPRRQGDAGLPRRRRDLDVQETSPSIVILLRQDDCVGPVFVSQQPQSILQAALRFSPADIDILELGGCNLHRAMSVLEQLGEIGALVAILRSDPDEVLRDDPLAEQFIQRCLEVCLLPQQIRP